MKHGFVYLFLSLLASQALAAPGEVVINELMYHPPGEREDLQFIELFNCSSRVVDLSGWAFKQGIEFRFPDSTAIAPGGYVVVARNTNALARHYDRELTNTTWVGNFGGKLSHNGETISLANRSGQVVDLVSYSDGGAWPRGADGYSASLERICPTLDGNQAANWSASKMPAATRAAGTPGRSNDSFAPVLPPVVSEVRFREILAPTQPITVTVAAAETATNVALLWQAVTDRGNAPEQEFPMKRGIGAQWEATLPGQPSGTLTRFRVRARDASGMIRDEPGPNEPHPTFSVLHMENTNTAAIPFAFLSLRGQRASGRRPSAEESVGPEPTRGSATFVIADTNRGAVTLFDHVRIQPRNGGWKVHFQRDRRFRNMSSLNIIFEQPRWVLAEPLGHEVFRRAGVPAPLTDYLRLWENGRPRGYFLALEQPNKTFLERNRRDPEGDLFKLLWYGQGLIGQHEKKTNPLTGHTNLMALVSALGRQRGAAQWQLILDRFNVVEVASYFAACQLIGNWDGYHNNEFIFHDVNQSGKWEVYPWDLDKTFGDIDNHPADYAWFTMPLTMGMEGNRPPLFGNAEWFREGGWFSRPLLANAEFRAQYLARLRTLCETEFTEAKLFPWITQLERRLEAEVVWRAPIYGEQPSEALRRFRSDLESLRRFIKGRREYLTRELR
jgi:hypothetical protein